MNDIINLQMDKRNLQAKFDMQSCDGSSQFNESKFKYERSFKYWSRLYAQLMKPNSVVFTANLNYKMTKLSPISVIRQLMNLNLMDNVEGMDILSNSNFFYIRFNSASQAAAFQNGTRQLENYNMDYVGLVQEVKDVWITVESTPPILIREKFQEHLEDFGKIMEIVPTKCALPGGLMFETSPTKIRLELNKEVTIQQLPYYLTLDDLKCYLKMGGRPSICYNCDGKNHLSRNCPFKYCKKCNKMQVSDHQCAMLYADKVKITVGNIEGIYKKAAMEQFPSLIQENESEEEQNDQSGDGGLKDVMSSDNDAENFYSNLATADWDNHIANVSTENVGQILDKVHEMDNRTSKGKEEHNREYTESNDKSSVTKARKVEKQELILRLKIDEKDKKATITDLSRKSAKNLNWKVNTGNNSVIMKHNESEQDNNGEEEDMIY